MSGRHSDSDGSDIFWPGYVDAVTNLVLNLLFLLTIMIVAVFMFALELGRATQVSSKTQAPVTSKEAKTGNKATPDAVRENIALKREIDRLNMIIARQVTQKVQPVQPRGVVKTVEVTSSAPKPQNVLEKTAVNQTEVVVRFKDEAVTLTSAEHEQLRESLKPIVAAGKSSIDVVVPAGFSEAKRMAFYRAMTIRNLLIEMKMSKDDINVSVVEGKHNGNASLVRVRAR